MTVRSQAIFKKLNSEELSSLSHNIKNFDKIHIGCGNTFLPGWLNIGLFENDKAENDDQIFPYGKITLYHQTAVLNYDINAELNFESNSLKYVFASHFIEHLSFNDAIIFLKKYFNFIHKDGIIRITCPDLELWIKKYYEDDTDFFDKYKRISLEDSDLIKQYLDTPTKDYFQTKGQILMGQIHNWGHLWNYDFESLENILQRAGFSKIKRLRDFESSIPDNNILDKKHQRLMESLYVEAKK